MSGQFTVSTGLSHDELVRAEALRLAIEAMSEREAKGLDQNDILVRARKFEAFIRDRS